MLLGRPAWRKQRIGEGDLLTGRDTVLVGCKDILRGIEMWVVGASEVCLFSRLSLGMILKVEESS